MTTTTPPIPETIVLTPRAMSRNGYITTFTDAERAYLAAQPLGRLATIGRDGAPQNSPVAFWVSGDTIEVGGPSLRHSQKYRNIQADPRIAFVVDDNADEPVGPGGQRGRGVEIRGRAELLILDELLMDGFTNDRIRLHPHRILAWNLDGPGANTRTPSPHLA